jgi:flagellin-specific chaperone FliS
MTQLSANTVLYDQIVAKVSNFINEYRENKFPDNNTFLDEYQNLINSLNRIVGRTTNPVRYIHKR